MNRDDGIAAVVLAAKHFLDLGGLDLRGQVVQALRQVLADILTLARPLDEHFEVVTTLFQRLRQFVVLLQSTTTLQHALRLGGIVPEIWRRGLFLEPCDFVSGAGRVKDNSADQLTA